MSIQVACAQTAPFKGEIGRNLDHISEILSQASTEGIDIVLFPETATSGYFVEGGILECSLTAHELLESLTERCAFTKPLDVAIGFYESDNGNVYNSVGYLELGESPKLIHVYRKFFLPTYGVFDEERFCARGRELGVFTSRLGKMGILICEDVWHSILPTLLAVAGAQILLVPSASPARGFSNESPENLQRYYRMLRTVAEEHGVFLLNAQLCGFEGGKGFPGGSLIMSPFGEVLAQGPIQEEFLLATPINLELIRVARTQMPLLADLQSAWSDILGIANTIP